MNSPAATVSTSLNARVATTFAPPQLSSNKDWQVICHLGSGSTAHVWLMQHVSGKQLVACKTPKTARDAAALSQEAELASGLEHENLIAVPAQVPQVAGDGATCFEYLPAGSLENLVAASGKLRLANTVTVLSPMLYVVQYLHARQVVHGDISPRNILFDLTGKPVLIDLGASRATALAHTRTGTPGFIAPELANDNEPIDGLGAAADVYSLAALGWFCLTGTIPGPPQTRVPLVTLEPALSPEIIELLEAALAEEPALRPSLDRFAESVPYWANPEPVDLFAAVGEEYELLLPTRKPAHAPHHTRKPRLHGRPKSSLVSRIRTSKATGSSRVKALAISATLILTGGVVATATFGSTETQDEWVAHTSDHSEQSLTEDESVDFQATVDAIAKARSDAWAGPDLSLVSDYAAVDSGIFEDDISVLETLVSSDHTLEGIRMRAVVEDAVHQGNTAMVSVDWRVDSYTQLDAAGKPVEEFASRVDALDLRMENTTEGWKIIDVISD